MTLGNNLRDSLWSEVTHTHFNYRLIGSFREKKKEKNHEKENEHVE